MELRCRPVCNGMPVTLSELLGIEIPVIQAPMAGVQDWELAVAVTQAGGLGSIACGMLDAQQVCQQMAAFRERCAGPVNLNFFCHNLEPADPRILAQWQSRLAHYYEEFDLSRDSTPAPLRRPFDAPMLEALRAAPPAVISFHFGLPPIALLEPLQSLGTKVLATATTVAEAVWLEQRGVDGIILQGIEAGGHRGMFLARDLDSQCSTQVLLEAVRPVVGTALIAAGGIATAGDVQRFMRLGAAGVQVGTAYLLCDEAKTSEVHRAALCDVQLATAITTVFSGRPARGLRNRIMRELGEDCSDVPPFPYASLALAPLRARAEAQGRADFTPLWSGSNRSGLRAGPAAQLTRSLWQRQVD